MREAKHVVDDVARYVRDQRALGESLGSDVYQHDREEDRPESICSLGHESLWGEASLRQRAGSRFAEGHCSEHYRFQYTEVQPTRRRAEWQDRPGARPGPFIIT